MRDSVEPVCVSTIAGLLDNAADMMPAAGCSALAAHTLETGAVFFLIHEPSSVAVAFHPAVNPRIVDLRTIPNCTVAVAVSSWWICCHIGITSFCLT